MAGTDRTIYAHSLPDRPPSEWETLEVHAAEVARLAKSFATAFGAGDWGELLGRWHDLGKRSAEFQQYISRGDPDAGEEESAPGTRGSFDVWGTPSHFRLTRQVARDRFSSQPSISDSILRNERFPK
jgi:CRISPR-associated endonuclease Cas3-HD